MPINGKDKSKAYFIFPEMPVIRVPLFIISYYSLAEHKINIIIVIIEKRSDYKYQRNFLLTNVHFTKISVLCTSLNITLSH